MIILLILSIAFSSKVFSNEVTLPDYSIILDGQYSCDDSAWKKIQWSENSQSYVKLLQQTVSIVNDVQLSERQDRKKNPKDQRKYRSYELKYNAFGRIMCGKEAQIESAIALQDRPYITTAWKQDDHIDLGSDGPTYKEKDYMYYSTNPFGGDDPNPSKDQIEGYSCLVKLDEFLLHPFKSIDIDKLCKGFDERQRDFTRKEILKLVEFLKNKHKTNNGR